MNLLELLSMVNSHPHPHPIVPVTWLKPVDAVSDSRTQFRSLQFLSSSQFFVGIFYQVLVVFMLLFLMFFADNKDSSTAHLIKRLLEDSSVAH